MAYNADDTMNGSTIVAYFSASGVTARKAEVFAEAIGADIGEIVPAQRYTDADLNYRDRSSRSSVEMNDPSSRPAVSSAPDASGYDNVVIGFPVWWYTFPRIVSTYIESQDLSGKRIVLFATSGGTRIDGCVDDMKKNYPELDVIGGRLLNGDDAASMKGWFDSL